MKSFLFVSFLNMTIIYFKFYYKEKNLEWDKNVGQMLFLLPSEESFASHFETRFR